ncbi:hypothetical protein M0805_007572 [Coniferiporia weirii]|nr:hypothetical protein M0805_007572 [Coniferiporia weirii]
MADTSATKSSASKPASEIEEELTPQQLETFLAGTKLKEAGDQAFKNGDCTEALMNYHKTLLHLRGLSRRNPVNANQGQETTSKSRSDEEVEKVYANMTACYLKMSKYERAIQTADKVLALNQDNHKALFRKGKALGELGYFEKAEKILTDLITKNPNEAPNISRELERLREKDEERERKHNKKLRGFLNAKKDIFSNDETESNAGMTALSNNPPVSASIEEIKD